MNKTHDLTLIKPIWQRPQVHMAIYIDRIEAATQDDHGEEY
jgi:hypothetical protein